jgi:hypothetical protein
MVSPQQLGIGVSSSVELKHIAAWIRIEERLASGRGGAIAKDDHVNAHNTFDKRSKVLTAREWAKSKKPSAALFSRKSDFHTRRIFSPGLRKIRTEHGFFAREKLGASRGTPLQACSTLVESHKR